MLAAMILLTACNTNLVEHNDKSTNPTHSIISDGQGNHISKSVYKYNSYSQLNGEDVYSWDGSDWALEHEYTYKYEYTGGALLSKYSKLENGELVFVYEYEFENSVMSYRTYTDYTGEEPVVTKNKFTYTIDGSVVSSRNTYVQGTDPDTWVSETVEEFYYNGNTPSYTVVSRWVDEELVNDITLYYSYVNGLVSNLTVKKYVDESWVLYQNVDYTYDSYERKLMDTVTLYDLDADPVTSTQKITSYYYAD